MSSTSRTWLLAVASLLTVVACNAPASDSKPSNSTAPPAATSARNIAPGLRRVSIAGVDLTRVGYNQGSPTAPVVVVDLSDFGCPYCGQFARETYPTLDREYVQTGKVFFKYVPFVMGMFPNGKEAARAAECAGDQGKFWPMYDHLYEGQTDWKRTRNPYPLYQQYAAATGVDGARFANCYSSQETHPRTKLANDAARLLGVRATPSFLVNGRPIEGALPLADFRQVLNDAAAGAAK